jgi:hypothetical protein
VCGHPLASASCCRGIVTATVNTTTPSNASAATIAIIAIDVVVGIPSCDEWFMSNANPEYALNIPPVYIIRKHTWKNII